MFCAVFSILNYQKAIVVEWLVHVRDLIVDCDRCLVWRTPIFSYDSLSVDGNILISIYRHDGQTRPRTYYNKIPIFRIRNVDDCANPTALVAR